MDIPDFLSFSFLAASGFFYTGSGITIQCQECEFKLTLTEVKNQPCSQEYHQTHCRFAVAPFADVAAREESSRLETTISSTIPSSGACSHSHMHPNKETAADDLTKRLLESENQALKQLMTCQKCGVSPVEELFLPCGHMLTCRSCSQQFTHCPTCEKRIMGTVTVYFS